MIFYYSGAKILNGVQADPNSSLGNFISSTLVPNNLLGNVFGGVSLLTLQNGAVDCFALFLKNTTGNTVNNVLIQYAYPAGITNLKLEIASVIPNSSGQIEQISSSKSSPYYANFAEAVSSPVNIANSLLNGASIGLWLRRTFSPVPASKCDDLYTAYSNIVPMGDINNNMAIIAPNTSIPGTQGMNMNLNLSWS